MLPFLKKYSKSFYTYAKDLVVNKRWSEYESQKCRRRNMVLFPLILLEAFIVYGGVCDLIHFDLFNYRVVLTTYLLL